MNNENNPQSRTKREWLHYVLELYGEQSKAFRYIDTIPGSLDEELVADQGYMERLLAELDVGDSLTDNVTRVCRRESER